MSELYPESYQIPAMLINKAPKNAQEELATKKYIAQPKKDGAWYELEKTKSGKVYLFSRSKSKKTGELSEKIANVPHILEWADQLPNETILIGEIYYPGGKSNDTTKIMGSLPQKAIERQNGEFGLIHYYIHDILMWNGQSYLETDFEHRYSNLCKHVDIGCINPNYIEVAPSKTGYDIYECVQRWISTGEEGGVFKLKSGLYVPGKRPVYNFKLKEEVDGIDLIISALLEPEQQYTGKQLEYWPYWMRKDDGAKVQFEPKKGTCRADDMWIPITKSCYYNWTGSFELSAYDASGKLVKVGQVSSGLTDAMKEHSAMHPDKYLGSVCEVQAMSVDKDNCTLRHPRFIRLREDKNPEECRIEEIFK